MSRRGWAAGGPCPGRGRCRRRPRHRARAAGVPPASGAARSSDGVTPWVTSLAPMRTTTRSGRKPAISSIWPSRWDVCAPTTDALTRRTGRALSSARPWRSARPGCRWRCRRRAPPLRVTEDGQPDRAAGDARGEVGRRRRRRCRCRWVADRRRAYFASAQSRPRRWPGEDEPAAAVGGRGPRSGVPGTPRHVRTLPGSRVVGQEAADGLAGALADLRPVGEGGEVVVELAERRRSAG